MRLPVLTEEEMDPQQQELAARIAGRRGAVRGPFRVWLHSPEMCERAESSARSPGSTAVSPSG
ncbi:hypothetical protein SHKM778_56200 [Streptomyces sp. KM77-8]|uniref:Uncharacterized protein n=1 Tax=Streptomyces haneummycinicus TaxID=3074435 RepID=A0AAT9HNU1_9ACTN